MATEKEIQLACDIQRIGIQINMQGKYHTFVEFSGHVNWIEVRVMLAPFASGAALVSGWHGVATEEKDNSFVKLSTGYRVSSGENISDVVDHKVEQLEELKSRLYALLDRDDDGVPV